eukprot:Awhi_evm1s4835
MEACLLFIRQRTRSYGYAYGYAYAYVKSDVHTAVNYYLLSDNVIDAILAYKKAKLF